MKVLKQGFIGIVLSVLMVGFTSCNRFWLEKVDEEKSPSYRYTLFRKKILYENPIEFLTFSEATEVPADVASFKVLWWRVAKDKNHVFYKASILKNVDHASFRYDSAADRRFLLDKNHIYLFPSTWTSSGIDTLEYIEGADPETFRYITKSSSLLARDKNHYYWNLIPINVDYESFQYIGPFAYDKDSIYYSPRGSKSLKGIYYEGTLRKLSNYVLCDDVYVYCYYWVGAAFHSIPYTDFNRIKMYTLASENRLLNDYFAVESEVYYRGSVIEQADPDSFKVLDSKIAKDNKSVYYQGKLMEGADAPTFSLIKSLSDGNGKNDRFSKDRQFVYCDEEVFDKDADPDSFEVINWKLVKDKRYQWKLLRGVWNRE